MRTLLFIGVLVMTITLAKAQNTAWDYSIPLNTPKSLKEGWYEATVKYSNSNTYTTSTYTLDVKVENNKVVEISFGDGKSVHSGYNTHNYTYSGGLLNYRYYNGQISLAETTVTIYTQSGAYLTYKISIE